MPYYHMMNWLPFAGFWMMMAWLISLAIAYLVYRDAENRGMNGPLWGLPILIPWIGALFLVLYLIMRDGGHHLTGTEKAKAMPEDILNARYARGELTREVYLQMKEDLGKPVNEVQKLEKQSESASF